MPPKKGGKKSLLTGEGSGSSTPLEPSLVEQLSYIYTPRPFKNPNYRNPHAGAVGKRAKTLKSVLNAEREREKLERQKRMKAREEQAASQDQGDAMNIEEEEEIPSYSSIEAPPSVLPQKHYCDVTGLEAPYTDPRTKLRYHDKNIYAVIKTLNPAAVQEYLSLRGQTAIVK